jgi:uncharacterized phage protein (TIGR01671 family)
MNRPINFRAWDDFNETMWESGDDLGLFFISMEELQKAENKIHFMQFSGLLDKNGVEIFEGDLVQHEFWDEPHEIIFDNEKARFVCKMKTGLTRSIDGHNMVVIGNIHETK